MKERLFTLLTAFLATTASYAQWEQTEEPMVIVDCTEYGSSYASNPMAARTSDGKTWISYMISNHTYLQLLDKNGKKQFDDPGIQLNDYPTPSWTSFYQLAVASDGSALVSVSDSRSETADGENYSYQQFQPTIYKISQKGEFEWGPDGITFEKYQDAAYTNIYVNGDDIFFQFTDNSDENGGEYMNRISLSGTLAFNECKKVPGIAIPSLNGDLLLFNSTSTGSTIERLSRDLEPIWDAPVTFDDNGYGGHEIRCYKAVPDGNGGAAVTFLRKMGIYYHNIRIQYIDGDGNLGFGLTGIDAYNSEDGDHNYPGIAINTDTKEILVDWEDRLGEDYTPTYTTAVGKYTYSGERLWGDYGKVLANKETASEYAYSRIGAGALPCGDWIIAYRDGAGWDDETIIITRLDKDGNEIWTKKYGQNITARNPSIFVENDFTYIIYRDKNSLSALCVSNEDGTAGIDGTELSDRDTEPETFFAVDGTKLDKPRKGINIARMSDNSTRKFVVR